jgi:hypothetical protein
VASTKALAVLALKNYAYRELDIAEQILMNILRHCPDFIKYLLEEEGNVKEGLRGKQKEATSLVRKESIR